jgi:FHA domain
MVEGKGPVRPPLRRRSRRRWAVVGGVAAGWLVLEVLTGSAVTAIVLLLVIAALGAATVGGLRAMGITGDHPGIQRLASRPWRDGQDVLRVAMRHLQDVFVITPSGSLLAPNVVEVQLNPQDLISLCDQMDIGVITTSLSEVYEERVAACRARLAAPGRAAVYVIAADSVAPGGYRLRQGRPAGAEAGNGFADPQVPHPAPQYAYAAPGGNGSYASNGSYPSDGGYGTYDWAQPGPGLTTADPVFPSTVQERAIAPVPVLRLVTGDQVAQTRMSGARAGRGSVELKLPVVPTVSREHARFTFTDGHWWITNLGMNGITVNGLPVAGDHMVGDGDMIRWGSRPDALLSRVEIC